MTTTMHWKNQLKQLKSHFPKSGVLHSVCVLEQLGGRVNPVGWPGAPSCREDLEVLRAVRSWAQVTLTSTSNLRAEPNLSARNGQPGLKDRQREVVILASGSKPVPWGSRFFKEAAEDRRTVEICVPRETKEKIQDEVDKVFGKDGLWRPRVVELQADGIAGVLKMLQETRGKNILVGVESGPSSCMAPSFGLYGDVVAELGIQRSLLITCYHGSLNRTPHFPLIEPPIQAEELVPLRGMQTVFSAEWTVESSGLWSLKLLSCPEPTNHQATR